MELFDKFLEAENAFFAYFGYYPARSRYSERHPILDFRTQHWLVVGESDPCTVCYSVQKLTGLTLEIGQGIFAEEILGWLGTNRKSHAKGGLWRRPNYTLIATSLPNHGERRFLLFSNGNECRNSLLARQALAQLQA